MIRSENNQSVLPQITRYWDQRAQGYALQVDDEFKESLQDVYLPWFETVVSESSVLDVGCGPGFFSVLLAKAGFAVTAFDASAEMLKKARERANVMGAYIDAVLGDAQILPFADNTFDCVCSRNLVWNLEMPQTAYREWLRVLKPGGVLLIFDGNHYRYLTAPNRNDKPHSQTHKHLGQVDISIMENIAKKLPMSSHDRPDYDHKLLDEVGFINIDTIVLSQSQGLVRDFAILCEKKYAD